MVETSTNHDDDMFTVVSWNILLDKTRTAAGIISPQSHRLASHIYTLASLDVPTDVVCLQEVEKTEYGHHGEIIASQLGYVESYWYEHNTSKRKGEHIGMFGNLVNKVDVHDMPHDKRAVVTYLGDIAVVGIHNRNEKWGPKRTHQMQSVIDFINTYDRAVIMGDSNALHSGVSRKLVEAAGFVEVWQQIGKKRPATFPTPEYRYIMKSPPLSLDVIYTRNVAVHETGVFKGDSDHYGIWATLRS